MQSVAGQQRIQPFAIHDLPGLYRICAEVDARGGTARQQLHAPDLAGHVFAGPYVAADPSLCWVVADEQGVAGYIVATDDAERFERWREKHWYPPLRLRHGAPSPRSNGGTDDRYLRLLHSPPRQPEAIPPGYPAELHIKLDPRAAGQGWGRRLIETLMTELRDRRLPGIHLGVAAQNTNAIGFYTRVGFRVLQDTSASVIMGRDLP
jgi:ribosomal protein S18 acetylase RimI-like enzyme